MKKGWVFLFGALVGGAVGWVSGVLSAPRPGTETMNVLSNKAIELSNMMGFYGTQPAPTADSSEPCDQAMSADEQAAEETTAAEPGAPVQGDIILES